MCNQSDGKHDKNSEQFIRYAGAQSIGFGTPSFVVETYTEAGAAKVRHVWARPCPAPDYDLPS